jgi:hypothetical protein
MFTWLAYGSESGADDAMTNDELDAEHALIAEEHARLEAEHAALEKNPKDAVGHLAHAKRLKAHVERLHRYMAARGYAPPLGTDKKSRG